MDDLKQYRAMCANRVRRLERFKKTRSFCSLEQETAAAGDSDYASSAEPELVSSTSCFFPSSSASSMSDDDELGPSTTFNLIKEKMMALMEDDVSLLQQLVTLSEKISEVKRGRGLLARSQSQSSLRNDDDFDEDDDRFDDDENALPRFAASVSAVTTLYVDDSSAPPSAQAPQPPQYFSRKNSVLRIPIPPRASNRINRRPSDMHRYGRPLQVDPVCQLSIVPGPSKLSPRGIAHSPSSPASSSPSSACSTVSSASGAKILSTQSVKALRGSSASTDSGRASSDSSSSPSTSPSPTFGGPI